MKGHYKGEFNAAALLRQRPPPDEDDDDDEWLEYFLSVYIMYNK